MRQRGLIVAGVAAVIFLTGCGAPAPVATPTVTVTMTPAPAPTVTVTAAPDPDAPLSAPEAWTVCAAAALGELHEAMYTAVEPATGGEVNDRGDGTYSVTVLLDTTGGLQPVFVTCEVSGSMRDPRVTIDVNFAD